MNYDIIEIGTSDFRIDSLSSNKLCLLVEPVKYYLDRIPNKPNIKKSNLAISDKEGTVDVYYTSLDFITQNGLPNWLRGCNSIIDKHPTVVQYCKDNSINESDLIIQDKIKILTPESLFFLYDVNHINYLKIDTEGHDTVILKSLLNSCNKPTIDKIKFESNILTDEKEYAEVVKLLEPDYIIIRDKFDTTAIKK